MSYPFDPKELDFTKRSVSFNPAVPGRPLFNFPVTEREALLSLFRDGKGIWTPYGVETGIFCPSVVPDNIARGFVFEATRWPEPYTTYDDMFGINWTYIPTVGGSMETPGIFTFSFQSLASSRGWGMPGVSMEPPAVGTKVHSMPNMSL